MTNSKNLPRDRAGDDTEEEMEYLKEKNIYEEYQAPAALSISFHSYLLYTPVVLNKTVSTDRSSLPLRDMSLGYQR